MHKPSKRFGQNFLRDTSIIEKIVQAIAPDENDHIIEIGPGEGALTSLLLKRVHCLDVIELDRDLIPGLLLLKELSEHELIIHQADALRFDYRTLVRDGESLTIVGNLPYNISTQLLFHLFSTAKIIKRMVFMLQKEVVDRLVAPVGTKAYGRLGIMARYFCETTHLFDVPPEAFYPQPKVNSAVVSLEPYKQSPYPSVDVDVLSRLVAKAFMQRRKTLRNALKGYLDLDAATALGIDLSKRPEQLRLEEYIELTQLI